MGLSRFVSEINGDFGLKRKFPQLPSIQRLSLTVGIVGRLSSEEKTRMMSLTCSEKFHAAYTAFVYTQYRNMTDGRTEDRQKFRINIACQNADAR